MGDVPPIRRTKKASGRARGPRDGRDPYPTANLPPAGAPGELSLFTEEGIRDRIMDIAERCRAGARRASPREEVQFLGAELRAIALAREIVAAESQASAIATTVKAAADLERLLKRGAAGSVVRTDNAPPFRPPDPPATH